MSSNNTPQKPSPQQLGRALLLGFLPILVFIIVEQLLGTVAGIIAALIMSFAEGLIIFIRERRFDRLLLLDVVLVGLLGGFSLVSGDDLFFKLKPALFEGVFLVMILLSLTGIIPIIELMMKRQLKGTGMEKVIENPDMKRRFSHMLSVFAVVIGCHIALIVWAALYASSGVYGFISGALLFIVFGVWFFFAIISRAILRK